MNRLTHAVFSVLVWLASGPATAQDSTPLEVSRQGVASIASRLPKDPAVLDVCTRMSARAMRTYDKMTASGRGAEAMTAVREDLEQRFAHYQVYVCGIFVLAATHDRLESDDEAARQRALDSIPVAVAMNWASANAMPFGNELSGEVFFGSAAASALYGMPESSTAPVFCIAARSDLAEAQRVLRAMPGQTSCEVAEPAPAREEPEQDDTVVVAARATVPDPEPEITRASSPPQILSARTEPDRVREPEEETRAPAREPQTATETPADAEEVVAEVTPEPEAEPGPPPRAENAAYRDPPQQRAPEQIPPLREGLSGCQVFYEDYWSDTGDRVSVADTFCKNERGQFVQVDQSFTVSAE